MKAKSSGFFIQFVLLTSNYLNYAVNEPFYVIKFLGNTNNLP